MNRFSCSTISSLIPRPPMKGATSDGRLCGLRARSDIKGFVDPRSAEDVATDRKVMSDFENEIRSIVTSDGRINTNGTLEKFNPSKYRKWKPGWDALAAVAGFEVEKAKSVYAYLSAYAHGD